MSVFVCVYCIDIYITAAAPLIFEIFRYCPSSATKYFDCWGWHRSSHVLLSTINSHLMHKAPHQQHMHIKRHTLPTDICTHTHTKTYRGGSQPSTHWTNFHRNHMMLRWRLHQWVGVVMVQLSTSEDDHSDELYTLTDWSSKHTSIFVPPCLVWVLVCHRSRRLVSPTSTSISWLPHLENPSNLRVDHHSYLYQS